MEKTLNWWKSDRHLISWGRDLPVTINTILRRIVIRIEKPMNLAFILTPIIVYWGQNYLPAMLWLKLLQDTRSQNKCCTPPPPPTPPPLVIKNNRRKKIKNHRIKHQNPEWASRWWWVQGDDWWQQFSNQFKEQDFNR